MDRHSTALALAGVIGSSVAVVHGVLTQRVMVEPLQELAGTRVTATVQRLVAVGARKIIVSPPYRAYG